MKEEYSFNFISIINNVATFEYFYCYYDFFDNILNMNIEYCEDIRIMIEDDVWRNQLIFIFSIIKYNY